MKTTITVQQEVDIARIKVDVAVRYGNEDIDYDFPLRIGDVWVAVIDIDEGRIIDWPSGRSGRVYMKVCDEGVYTLFDRSGAEIKRIAGYVPNELIPGEYGDYIDLDIDESGKIKNWLAHPSFSDFFE